MSARCFERKPLGASDFSAAIRQLATIEFKQARLLIVSDAVATAGETSPAALAEQLRALPWLQRVDVLIPAYHHDSRLAQALTLAGPQAGIQSDLALADSALVSRLLRPLHTDVAVAIQGAAWQWPEQIAAVQAGDAVTVFAQLKPAASVSITVNGQPRAVTVKRAEPLLLQREWVRARIERLVMREDQATDPDTRAAFHRQIIRLSVQERVLSPYTALLVLESEADYRRFRIDRRALADILTIDANGLRVLQRRQALAPAPAPAAAKPREDMAFEVAAADDDWGDEAGWEETEELMPEEEAVLAELKDMAWAWHSENPADVMALIALGESYAASGQARQAARAYGALLDYFPARTDIRRWTAQRLLALGGHHALAVDSLEKALAQRADHPSGHYLLALAYYHNHQPRAAVETLQAALKQTFNPQRFEAARQILAETLDLLLADLERRGQRQKLFPHLAPPSEPAPQLRLVLLWETDANDVDLHIYDKHGNHAYFQKRNLPADGGRLYADITSGYGPECFAISNPQAFPYRLRVHYYNMGPMGYGMGMLHVLRYDETGLKSGFEPFVVMRNGAFVTLGEVNK